jgi:hypothetical protein
MRLATQQADVILELVLENHVLQSLFARALAENDKEKILPLFREERSRFNQVGEALDVNEISDEQDDFLLERQSQLRSDRVTISRTECRVIGSIRRNTDTCLVDAQGHHLFL